MTKFAIELEDERVTQLRERAQRRGIAPEALIQARVEAWLDEEKAFEVAANYVLKKNAELYRRLA